MRDKDQLQGFIYYWAVGADGNPHRIIMEIERNRRSGPDKAVAAATTYINGNGVHQACLHKPDVWAGVGIP